MILIITDNSINVVVIFYIHPTKNLNEDNAEIQSRWTCKQEENISSFDFVGKAAASREDNELSR